MLIVGGNWNNGSNAGVRAANANNSPGNVNNKLWWDHRRILRPNVTAGRRRMRKLLFLVRRGDLDGRVAVNSLRSWFAHLSHADTHKLRASLWREAKPILGGSVC